VWLSYDQPGVCVGLCEQAIERRRARCEDARSNRLVELQMTVLLQRRDERREKRPETLATDPVRCFPQGQQCLPDRVVVYAVPGRPRRGCVDVGARDVQHTNGVLPRPPRHGDEFVEDPSLFLAGACPVSRAHGPHELAARVATDRIHRCLQSSGPLGSRSREATTSAR
jgi:hypothetical protein